MRLFRTDRFKASFRALPPGVRDAARKAYQLWVSDPRHPSLHFKPIRADVWSVRVTLNYRAIGFLRKGAIYWHWIGPHDEYERIIRG